MYDFFKVLADETRLRCLALIFENQELCVCELIHALNLPQSKISRHLSIIRLNGLVKQRRSGQWVFYSVNPQLPAFKKKIIQMTIETLQEQPPYRQDRQRLQSMGKRPSQGADCCDV